ncbi:hypothetical protein BD413DRAFT_468449 [Trametes elegans]|nr:hypothetical protein BD413DRAFT_468449 [Trametes elegans]
MGTHRNEIVDGWIRQIKSILIFAGLLSAILSPLIVDAYSRFPQPASPDPYAALLAQLLSPLSSFKITHPFVNSTRVESVGEVKCASGPSPANPDTTPQWIIRLNTLWFSSLFLSLAATLLGVTFHQWLTIYSQGMFAKAPESGLHQLHRLNNLRKWRVGPLVNILPI